MVFTAYAIKVALAQRYYASIKTWHLPPEFGEDLKYGKSIPDMIDTYKNTWMTYSPELKFIYVPLMEYNHWYLMVVSMSDRTVYHVDSYLQDHDIEDRRAVIRNVCEALYKIMTSDAYGDSAVYTPFDLEQWPIDIARGVPNMGSSANSSIWVLQWMLMEDSFAPNLPGL
ncbi:hypothetical protein RIF29_20931 [Crotalaria pallida]|uniref:Ubiquitin-like protease family profile domain-containing protein n=1 Tax=Crotalaria pallida TaxID=3830 RepID=A0AAN9F3I5_CROPI